MVPEEEEQPLAAAVAEEEEEVTEEHPEVADPQCSSGKARGSRCCEQRNPTNTREAR